MKLGEILSEKQTANFLLGKVCKLHITSYVNHVAKQHHGKRRANHAIVPDIPAMNFSAGTYGTQITVVLVGKQRLSLRLKHSQSASSYTRTTTPKTAPVDRRARMIVNSYSTVRLTSTGAWVAEYCHCH